jgi:hypothetical protein
MTDDQAAFENAPPQRPGVNPAALTLADAARLLTAAGGKLVTAAMLQAAIDRGAPALPDGRVNLVALAAWLERELAGRTRPMDGQA